MMENPKILHDKFHKYTKYFDANFHYYIKKLTLNPEPFKTKLRPLSKREKFWKSILATTVYRNSSAEHFTPK